MKNMFKVSLVAAALAGVCSTAHAARIDVVGGEWARTVTQGTHQVFTASNEWLSVHKNADIPAAITDYFAIVLEDQYSVDDRLFITFTGTSIDYASLPVSRIGVLDNGAAPTTAGKFRGVVTLGKTGFTVNAAGNTVVEYRVTNVSEGANTVGAVVSFGRVPTVAADGSDVAYSTETIKFDAAAVKASSGVNISVQAFYKNNGAEFDTGGIRRSNVALIATGNQLDGQYNGNLTARVDTFNAANLNSVMSRKVFVEKSGIGRVNTGSDAGNFERAAAGADSTFTNAATVATDSVARAFAFAPSTVSAGVNWDFGLNPATNVKTAVKLTGDFSWFVTNNPTTGLPQGRFGSTLTKGANTAALSSTVSWASACDAAATNPVTTTALSINCGTGWNFDFALGVGNLSAAAPGAVAVAGAVIPKQTFKADVTMTYEAAAGDANGNGVKGTKTLSQNVGTWTNDGTSVFIPYMPYGEGISQLLFVTNTGPRPREVAVDVYVQNHSLTSAITGFKDVTPLNVSLNVKPGITNITGDIRTALTAAGVWDGSRNQTFAFDLIVAGPADEVTVYSGYNVREDRNVVINTSNQGNKVTDHNAARL